MPIKLVVLSGTLEHKISLHPGEHTFGRNTLLYCKDKRISRQHGSLQVDKASVILKALHQNPCFFKKRGSTETNILTINNSVTLYNGDRFGLLLESDWYEVLYLPGDDEIVNKELTMQGNTEHQKENVDSTICNEAAEETDVVYTYNIQNSETTDVSDISNNQDALQNNQENLSIDHPENDAPKNQEDRGDNLQLQPTDENCIGNRNLVKDTENNTNAPLGIQGGVIGASDVPLETNEKNNGSIDEAQSSKDNSNGPIDVPQDENITEDGTDQNPHLKRQNSTDGNDDAKKMKLDPEVKKEPEDVKPSSSDQAGTSDNNRPPRERCMYGASCYRKNPQHHLQFSHPRDADWGPGERGVCPYGASCVKTDPRHWRDHTHPPGKLPPPPPGMQVVHRHGNVFYINASTVNFYDDHFQVEDNSGDSADFDYEFY